MYCGKSDKTGVDTGRLFKAISNGPDRFTAEQEQLGNALVKIRSSLQTNLSDQYNSFKFMPNNYFLSFTEVEYLESINHLPTSTLKPTLGDSKFYYSNLYPPMVGQENNVYSRVDSSYLVHKVRKIIKTLLCVRDSLGESNWSANT